MKRCLSGDVSPGKCFSCEKSPRYQCNLSTLCLHDVEDVILLLNYWPSGESGHFVIKKLIGLQVENDSRDELPSSSILGCTMQIVIKKFILHAA